MKTIGKTKYLQVVGLLTVAKSQNAALRETERALAKLLEQKDDDGYFSHVSDAVYSEYSPDELLKKMGIRKAK